MSNPDTYLDSHYKALSEIAKFYYEEQQFCNAITIGAKNIHEVMEKEPAIGESLTLEQTKVLDSILALSKEIIQYPLIGAENFMFFGESLCKRDEPLLSREQLIQHLGLTDEQSYRDLITQTLGNLERYRQEDGYIHQLIVRGQWILQAATFNQIISTLQSRHSDLHQALSGGVYSEPVCQNFVRWRKGIKNMEEAIEKFDPSLEDQREVLTGWWCSIEKYLELINDMSKESKATDLSEKVLFLDPTLQSSKRHRSNEVKGYSLKELSKKKCEELCLKRVKELRALQREKRNEFKALKNELKECSLKELNKEKRNELEALKNKKRNEFKAFRKEKHEYRSSEEHKKECEDVKENFKEIKRYFNRHDIKVETSVEKCIQELQKKQLEYLETEIKGLPERVASCLLSTQELLNPSCNTSTHSIDSGIGSVASSTPSSSRANSGSSLISLSSRANSAYSLEESTVSSHLDHGNGGSIAGERHSWPRRSKSQVINRTSLSENDIQFERPAQNYDSQSKPPLVLHEGMKASLEALDLVELGQEQKGLSKQPSVRDLGSPFCTVLPGLNSGPVSESDLITIMEWNPSLSVLWRDAIDQAERSKGLELREKISALEELLNCAHKEVEKQPSYTRSDYACKYKSQSRLKQWLATLEQNPDTAPGWWQCLRLKRQLQGLKKGFEQLTSSDVGKVESGLSEAIELITDIDKLSKQRSAVYRNAGSGLRFSLGFLVTGGSIAALTMLGIGVTVGFVGLLTLPTFIISVLSTVALGLGMYLIGDAVSRIKRNNHDYHTSQQPLVPVSSSPVLIEQVKPSYSTVHPQAPCILKRCVTFFAKVPRQAEVGAEDPRPQFSK